VIKERWSFLNRRSRRPLSLLDASTLIRQFVMEPHEIAHGSVISGNGPWLVRSGMNWSGGRRQGRHRTALEVRRERGFRDWSLMTRVKTRLRAPRIKRDRCDRSAARRSWSSLSYRRSSCW
jgi:hypothetical protein